MIFFFLQKKTSTSFFLKSCKPASFFVRQPVAAHHPPPRIHAFHARQRCPTNSSSVDYLRQPSFVAVFQGLLLSIPVWGSCSLIVLRVGAQGSSLLHIFFSPLPSKEDVQELPWRRGSQSSSAAAAAVWRSSCSFIWPSCISHWAHGKSAAAASGCVLWTANAASAAAVCADVPSTCLRRPQPASLHKG